MKSRPVSLNKDMVTALLDGCKTQHRFPVEIPEFYRDLFGANDNAETVDIDCPLGVVGDELWVRENWGYHGGSSGGIEDRHCIHVKYKADEHDEYNEIHFKNFKKMNAATPSQEGYKRPVDCEWMDEDEENDHYREYIDKWWKDQKHKPAETMQRWASRILLEITDVRTERLRDIDGSVNGEYWRDCLNEGVMAKRETVGDCNGLHIKVLWRFQEVWDKVHARTQYSWASNPLVWVVEFKIKQIKDNRKKRKTNTKAVAGRRRARRR